MYQHLNLSREALPVGAALFGQGTGQVWLRDVNCVGDEAHLLQCPATYPTGYRSKCNHGTDVGVLCGDWRRCRYHPEKIHVQYVFSLLNDVIPDEKPLSVRAT